MFKSLSLQPIPYQGSKRLLAPRICDFFPQQIDTFYEPFAGSAAVTLYAATYDLADRFVIGDFHRPLVELWRLIIDEPDIISGQYSEIWEAQFSFGEGHFNETRKVYNQNNEPALLLYLIARCVKNSVRFNGRGEFSQSVDRRRTGVKPERLAKNMASVSRLLKGRITVFHGDFQECTKSANSKDLIYLDPPYQGTTYGKDKRYASGLSTDVLTSALQRYNMDSVPYVLSYDGRTEEKTYGELLPDIINAEHIYINAGRSSQATLCGKQETTFESLYMSHTLKDKIKDK